MTAYEEVNKKLIEEEQAKQYTCTDCTRAPKETDGLLHHHYPPPSYLSHVRTIKIIYYYNYEQLLLNKNSYIQ